MTEILHYFPVAGVEMISGVLTINSGRYSCANKMYNVYIYPEGDGVKVMTERPDFGLALSKGEFDVNLITEDSIEEYKLWPWSKKKKKRSLPIVEFKTKQRRVYHVKNYLVINEIS